MGALREALELATSVSIALGVNQANMWGGKLTGGNETITDFKATLDAVKGDSVRFMRCNYFGSAKTDPVRFKWGFGEGLLKDTFAFKAYKSPIPKRRKLLAKNPFL